jgi:Domain of unknown function (DUF397)
MSLLNTASQPFEWRKAQRSIGNGNCVEVAHSHEWIVVRDSKNPDGAILAYNAESWRVFTAQARQGHFDAFG